MPQHLDKGGQFQKVSTVVTSANSDFLVALPNGMLELALVFLEGLPLMAFAAPVDVNPIGFFILDS